MMDPHQHKNDSLSPSGRAVVSVTEAAFGMGRPSQNERQNYVAPDYQVEELGVGAFCGFPPILEKVR